MNSASRASFEIQLGLGDPGVGLVSSYMHPFEVNRYTSIVNARDSHRKSLPNLNGLFVELVLYYDISTKFMRAD